jgi:hypothetical protein
MESVSQNVGVRGGGCPFLDERAVDLEEVFLPLEPRLVGDLDFLPGMGDYLLGLMRSEHEWIIAQMVCFSLGYNYFMCVQVSS